NAQANIAAQNVEEAPLPLTTPAPRASASIILATGAPCRHSCSNATLRPLRSVWRLLSVSCTRLCIGRLHPDDALRRGKTARRAKAAITSLSVQYVRGC